MSGRDSIRIVAILAALASCAHVEKASQHDPSPPTAPVATSVAHDETPPSSPAACATDSDCEIVSYDAAGTSPCCTCTQIGASHARAKEIATTCSASPRPFPEGLCVLSCLQTPGAEPRCRNATCVIGR